MSVFTVLEVKVFSGFYPSCVQCLRRVSVLPVFETTTQRPPQYRCRSCKVVSPEEEVEYRYCLTVAAQAAHDCREVVVFGESLNPVFGAPATQLQRYSCVQCLRRVSVLPVFETTTQRPPQYRCRSCKVVSPEEEVEYRYCLTVAAQAAHDCREVVVFGESLNPVFGAPATQLQRFIKSHVPDHVPMMSPLALFRVLAEPLHAVLSGRCFTAALTKTSRQVVPVQPRRGWCSIGRSCDINCRYIATKFKFLGDHSTVLSLLREQLATNNPRESECLNCDPEVRRLAEALTVSERSSELSSFCGSSLLSSVSSAGSQQSRCVILESASGETVSCGNKELISDVLHSSQTAVTSCVQSHNATSRSAFFSSVLKSTHSSLPMNSTYTSTATEPIGNTEEIMTECVSLCDGVIDELLSTWREEHVVNSPHNTCDGISASLHTHNISSKEIDYDDTLPNSESFLEEFQCDFEEPSVLVTSTITPSVQTASLEETVGLSKTKKLCCRHSQSLLKETVSQHISPLCLQLTPSNQSARVPHITPELFSGSFARFPSSNSKSVVADEKLSPELFGSPSSVTSSVPSKLSSAAVDVVEDVGTPSMGRHCRAVPKRRLLNPTQSEVLTAMRACNGSIELHMCTNAHH